MWDVSPYVGQGTEILQSCVKGSPWSPWMVLWSGQASVGPEQCVGFGVNCISCTNPLKRRLWQLVQFAKFLKGNTSVKPTVSNQWVNNGPSIPKESLFLKVSQGSWALWLMLCCEPGGADMADGYQLFYCSELRKVAPNEEELWVILQWHFQSFRNADFPWPVSFCKPGYGLTMTMEFK